MQKFREESYFGGGGGPTKKGGAMREKARRGGGGGRESERERENGAKNKSKVVAAFLALAWPLENKGNSPASYNGALTKRVF